jgi:hypothetical protein
VRVGRCRRRLHRRRRHDRLSDDRLNLRVLRWAGLRGSRSCRTRGSNLWADCDWIGRGSFFGLRLRLTDCKQGNAAEGWHTQEPGSCMVMIDSHAHNCTRQARRVQPVSVRGRSSQRLGPRGHADRRRCAKRRYTCAERVSFSARGSGRVGPVFKIPAEIRPSGL